MAEQQQEGENKLLRPREQKLAVKNSAIELEKDNFFCPL